MNFKYLILEITHDEEGDEAYEVLNKKSGLSLGMIYKCHDWNKYVFSMHKDIQFDLVCLKELISFMENLK